MPPGLKVDIDGDTSGLDGAMGSATKSVSIFGKTLDTGLPTGKVDLAIRATKKLAGVTKDVAVAGKDAAAAEAAFNEQLGNLGISADAYAASNQKVIASSQQLAFTDDEARNSLVALATATGDMTQAQELLAVAQDVSRLSGSSLEQSADAVAKAYAGTDRQLKAMIPGLEAGATGMDTINNAQVIAQGSADAYAKSGAAMGEKVKIAFSEVAEAVGNAFLPALQDLGEALAPLIISLLKLAQSILPVLIPLITTIGKVAEIAAKAITRVADAVNKLITKIKQLLAPLREAVSGLQNLDFNPFSVSGASAGAAPMATTKAAANGGGHGPVTINIYGDPAVIEARVVRALRGYQARNGVGSVFSPGRS